MYYPSFFILHWRLWNTGISSRLPSSQLLLSVFSRKGWRKFGQKSFPISSIDWTPISPFLYPPTPPANHPLTVIISICYHTACSIYTVRLLNQVCRCTRCIIYHIARRSWEHFKMKFLWRYGRELCDALELIQILHAQNDKDNCVDFYNSVFPGEAKMC